MVGILGTQHTPTVAPVAVATSDPARDIEPREWHFIRRGLEPRRITRLYMPVLCDEKIFSPTVKNRS